MSGCSVNLDRLDRAFPQEGGYRLLNLCQVVPKNLCLNFLRTHVLLLYAPGKMGKIFRRKSLFDTKGNLPKLSDHTVEVGRL